ncbi:DNA-binding protein [Bacillus cereus]|uniref:HTH cro/C1-type domain-containing protein n=2 Tax=Bacillus cereus group TaxID=86661 RepID=A0A9X5MYY3_BACTU|nr:MULTISPECIES: XRE family transcriptional regulator [Bacillus cereus group]MEB9855896.1 XRE family transcriptional regulator [Bacillus cereus]MEB9887294.1 XRE family transcriptional regulator [Bacillus cereus]OFC88857.1 hypothetical protein BTGOE4_58830 [Bacillus thuringiensis]OOR12551.1 DNA-binding protein [Bacillus cereus]PFD49247.1 DNA-binding protein [Bacillus cereus]
MNIKQIFIPERLKSARIYRGKTIAELAEETGVTKQAISQYENGKYVPSLETLLCLIGVLNFPREYFYKPYKNEIKVGNTFFRSLFTTSKKERNSQEEKIKNLSELYGFLEEYVNFPEPDIPELNENNPEKAAIKLRKYWGLGEEPIPNMVRLLEKKGFIVTSLSSGSNKVDAFSQYQKVNGKEIYFIVLSKEKNSAVRRQFDAAHELGHIFLHNFSTDINEITRDEFRDIEREADDFAASFLLPADSFIKDLIYPNKLEFYIELKKKWKVSVAAMIVRAYKLKVISYNTYQYLMRQISSKNWRKREPLDDVLKVHEPIALKKAVELLLINDVLTGPELVRKLMLSESDIEQLLNLTSGMLKSQINDNEVIVELASKRSGSLS